MKRKKNLRFRFLSLLLCCALFFRIQAPIRSGATELTPNPVSNRIETNRIPVSFVQDFESEHPLERTKAGVLLIDMTSNQILQAKNSTMPVTSSELSEWLLILYALRYGNQNAIVTLSGGMLKSAGNVEYPNLIGLKEGDVLTLEDLVKIFLMTKADDARVAIATNLFGSERQSVPMLNQMAEELGFIETNLVASDGAYVFGQQFCAYDLYAIFYELLHYPVFSANYTKSSLSVSVTGQDGTKRTIQAKNQEHGYSNLYGAPAVAEGQSFVARFSGGCVNSSLSQLLFARDANNHLLLSILTGISFEKDIAIESKRLLSTAMGGEYIDKRQELPIGDDTVRYRYLMGTDVKYYTVDDKAPGYKNDKETSRYMMTISVPVWHLNDETGEKTPSTMSLTIHRKLVVSCKKIFQEIYELPMQFPIKKLSGYGYRQSGGVGLSNCTLMSIHSYGAAIDINPGDYDNDYFLGAGNDLRDKTNPYCIPDEVVEIFEKNGWFWGGNFSICVDSMHFQYLGLDYLTYQNNSPFMTVDLSEKLEVGYHIENLQDRLLELGYSVNRNGIFSEQTRRAVMKFQKREGLPVTGVVDYKTWETIINKTHYMRYAF